MKPLVALFGFVGICLAVGAVGGYFTADSIPTWYAALQKPSWNPPSSVFAPVWTILYILMGVSAFMVWREGPSTVNMGLFAVQLTLNLAWSILFFGMRRPDLAFYEIILLWLSILATALVFAKVDRVAGWLLAPYLAWVTFAAVLNFTIWRLNPL